MSVHRKTDIWGPVRVATSGLVHTFKTQRHMRFHLYVVLVVTLLGVFFNLGLREMLVLLFTISLVLVAEMFNSAIEATVDLVHPNYHPMAKFAKDIAAGAVLITTIIALVVGSLMILGGEPVGADQGQPHVGIAGHRHPAAHRARHIRCFYRRCDRQGTWQAGPSSPRRFGERTRCLRLLLCLVRRVSNRQPRGIGSCNPAGRSRRTKSMGSQDPLRVRTVPWGGGRCAGVFGNVRPAP